MELQLPGPRLPLPLMGNCRLNRTQRLQDWFLDLSNLRVLAVLVALLLLRKALHLGGLCSGSLPTLVDYQS